MEAPVFFVKKKDGSLHLVQDYWKLNKIMVKNSYPLPLVSDVLTCLHGAEFFTVLNLHWGFNNVQNSQSGLQMEVEVRERKNEFGNSEEVCRATELVLLFCGQPIWSTGVGGILVWYPTCL